MRTIRPSPPTSTVPGATRPACTSTTLPPTENGSITPTGRHVMARRLARQRRRLCITRRHNYSVRDSPRMFVSDAAALHGTLPQRLQCALGLVVFLIIAYAIGRLRGARGPIPWRAVFWGIALQFVFA